jgi:hypothetical protein
MERLESVFCACEFRLLCFATLCSGSLAAGAFLLLR